MFFGGIEVDYVLPSYIRGQINEFGYSLLQLSFKRLKPKFSSEVSYFRRFIQIMYYKEGAEGCINEFPLIFSIVVQGVIMICVAADHLLQPARNRYNASVILVR